LTRRAAIARIEERAWHPVEWPTLRRRGWRIARVRITEIQQEAPRDDE